MCTRGVVNDVIVRDLPKFVDDRGWLTEPFRGDYSDPRYMPGLAYISMTHPGAARGPHEHVDQADICAFIGHSDFMVFLWDKRKDPPTYVALQVIDAGENPPRSITMPPGVVHAYRNGGGKPGMVMNLPNRLCAGRGIKDPAVEIRHEADPKTINILD